MPPIPGQSRSLLQFAPAIKQEYYGTPAANAANNKEAVDAASEAAAPAVAASEAASSLKVKTEAPEEVVMPLKRSPSSSPDHDYVGVGGQRSVLNRKKNPYIEEDVEPEGYGPGLNRKTVSTTDERRINVTAAGGAMRTVVLHVPKDIK